MPDPQDPTILKTWQKLVFSKKNIVRSYEPETGNTKLVKGLLKKCVLQEKPEQEKSFNES